MLRTTTKNPVVIITRNIMMLSVLFVSSLLLLQQGSVKADEVERGFSPLACRRDPTWRGIYDECAEITEWSPRARFWNTSTLLKQDTEAAIRSCLDKSLSQKVFPEMAGDYTPVILGKYPSGEDEEPRLVEVARALTEKEVFSVKALAACLREHQNEQFEVRPFEGNDAGGNNCTYLNPYLQIYVPGIASQLIQVGSIARKAAGWDRDAGEYPNPRTLGLRTSEHLQYGTGGNLGIHVDAESIYTILVALSNSNDYSGGEYVLETETKKNGGERKTYQFKPPKLSAMVFLSHTAHKVNFIPEGVRETFANELWVYDDVPIGHRRPGINNWHEYGEKESFKDESEL